MSTIEELTEEMSTLAKSMASSSGDLAQLAKRFRNAKFHKSFMGHPSIPEADAKALEQGLDEGGHDVVELVDEIVGWAERSQPFQVRASTADHPEADPRYGVVQIPALNEEVDLRVLVAEARAMMKTINAFSGVLDKGVHHLSEDEVRHLAQSLDHYAKWLSKMSKQLGGNPPDWSEESAAS